MSDLLYRQKIRTGLYKRGSIYYEEFHPNIEAATKVAKHRMPFIDWSTAEPVILELVAAALTPQGED